MTSTYQLQRRKEMESLTRDGTGVPQVESTWAIHDKYEQAVLPMRGEEDTYIINGAHRECHPDYQAIPIDGPYGMMVCKRMRPELNDPRVHQRSADVMTRPVQRGSQAYGRYGNNSREYQSLTTVTRDHEVHTSSHSLREPVTERVYIDRSVDLYPSTSGRGSATGMGSGLNTSARRSLNPYSGEDRGVPNEQYLARCDYISRDIKFNGTGIPTARSVGSSLVSDVADYTTQRPIARDPRTGTRTGSGSSSVLRPPGYAYVSKPPPKYDVHRLHQAYPIWRQEQRRMGVSYEVLDKIDRAHTERWV